MGSNEKVHQLQQLLDVSYGDEIVLFPTIVSGQQVLLVKRQRSVLCFRLVTDATSTDQWEKLWSQENFFGENVRDVYGFFYVDSSGWLLMKNRNGLQIYRMEGHELNLRHYFSDGRYRDLYGWNDRDTVFLMGHIYAESGKIGVLSRNKRGTIKFEQMVEGVVLEGGSQALLRLSNGPTLPESWKLKSTRLGLAIVDGGTSQQSAIIERSLNGIMVYKLDPSYQLQIIAHIEDVPFTDADDERILFGSVFGKATFKDLLHFNETGLYLYKHEGSNYRSVYHDSSFGMSEFGWQAEHWRTANLVDTTGDGRDQLWLTSPQGIFGFRFTEQGVEKISSYSVHNDDVRYAKLMTVITKRGNPIFVAVGGRKLYSLGFQPSNEPTTKPDVDSTVEDDTCSDIEPMFTLHSIPGPIVEASLAEMLDTSLLQEPINPMDGSLNFAIPLLQVGPLFNLQTSKLITYQERDFDTSMGRGWSLQVDCVFIDRRNSIFAEDHRYYLIKDGSSKLLTASLSNDSSEEQPRSSFTIDGNNHTTITFDRVQNRWSIVDQDNRETLTYGTYDDKKFIKMDNGSADWPFPIDGTKYQNQGGTLLSSVWYLLRHTDHAGQWVEYSYKSRSITEEFLLESIITSAGASLRTSYTAQFGKTLFTGYTIRTASYTQSVTLEYIQTADVVRLSRISQLNKTVLQFNYNGPSGEMTEITYPNGLKAQFKYTLLQIERNLLINRFETFSHPRAAYGPGYLLVADITKHRQVRLHLRDVLGSDTIAIAGSPIPLLGKLPVFNYELFPGESYFAVLLHHDQRASELCLFQSQGDIWQANPTYLKLPKDTSIRSGQDFLLVVQSKRVTVVERQNGKWIAQKRFDNEQSALMQFFSHGFLSYTDQHLKLYVRRAGQWTPTVLNLPSGLITESTSVFDRFDHPPESIDHLKKGILPDALGMFHNIIVVRSFYFDGSKLYARLNLLHLNGEHEVTRREVVRILIEDLETYTFNPPEQNGNTFVLAYRIENGKFKLKVIEHRGKIVNEIEKIKEQIEKDIRDESNAPEEKKERYRRESLEKLNNELQDLYRNITAQIPFAIDPSKLSMIISDSYIITASHKILFDGVKWTKEKIPQEELTMSKVSIDLGTKYRLVKMHRNATFNLLGPNQNVELNTDTRDASDLYIRYPGFFAVQTNDSSVQVFDFERGQLNSLPAGEKLEACSNQLAVISTQTDGKALFICSIKSFDVTLQNVIGRYDLLDRRGRQLTNYYQFDPQSAKPHGTGFILGDVKITPASTIGPYGWYKEHYNFANHTLSTKTVYNSKGEFVQEINNTNGEQNGSLSADGVLTARDGKTVVADFRPFQISNEVVSYYGFEPYEQNRIGTDRVWIWKNGQVLQEGRNHFLRLGPSSSLSESFQPKNFTGTLVVSCWLRTASRSIDISNTLSVTYGGKTIKATVRSSIEGWRYAEVLVEGNEAFIVNISPGNTGASLDVDHLKVNPIELELEVNIYDFTTARKQSTMHGSGFMSHYLRDGLGNEMGHINEQGSVDSFTIISRCHNIRIEMKPALGEVLKATQSSNYSGSFKYIPQTAVIRFRYGGKMSDIITARIGSRTFSIEIAEHDATLRIEHHSAKIPPVGDMVVFSTSNRYSIWIDGLLKLENLAPETRFDTYVISSAQGQVWDAVLLYDTSVNVIYLSDFGMPKQILELHDPNVVALQEIVYDDLNRPAIKTKWTILNSVNSSELFAYRSNFIKNETRVWIDGLMEGPVSELNADCAGYPYSRILYRDTPLEEKAVQSHPGKKFAIDGAFAKHYETNSSIDFLENLFPQHVGFRYEYERYPDQSIYVKIFDNLKRKVAEYVRSNGGDHHLTTFQYDDCDRLILQLPPAYHETADTFSRTTPFFGGQFSSELADLQQSWGTRYEYDQKSGLMTLKRTPDTGDVRYLYTPEGLLRFVVQPENRNVMFFSYTSVGKLAQRGMIDVDPSELTKYLSNDSQLPPSKNFALFNRADTEVVPQYRHRVQNIQKFSNDRVISELLFFDHEKQLISSILYSNSNSTVPIGYKYCKSQIQEIKYPIAVEGKVFRLRYEYDHRGKVISLANAASNEKFVVMENNSMGLPKYMIIQPNTSHAFRRTFQYNQPGYLTSIQDPYLTESIDYVGKGYGGRAVGDGTVQMTRFNATWHQHSKTEILKLKPSHFGDRHRAKICYDALKSSGYLDTQGRPVKSMYPLLALDLPIVCRLGTTGHLIASVLNGAGFPLLYGHMYDYGSHRQLIRAKYFQNVAEELYEPLRKDAFDTINGINTASSANIWNILHEAGYIHSDCASVGRVNCQGLPGKSIFHPTIAKHPNSVTLGGLMALVITSRKGFSKRMFDILCASWYREDLPNVILEACSSIWKTLIDEKFLGPDSSYSLQALNPELRDLLSAYTPHLPEIIGMLYRRLATSLGHSSGDVQSYEIDANGNHRHFYTGFRRYRLEYVKNSNKIAAVHRLNLAEPASGLEEKRFPIDHNDEGSVTRAMHKGIQRITYDPLYNRATEVLLTDGRRLKFDYNVRGQRLYKHVYARNGKLLQKKYYVRDVQGKPLIEYEAIYQGINTDQPLVRATIFLYAEDRLIGFIRNDQFYSVALDHEGSVRLVIKNGEIVAAYDYLPYGELLRKYGEDPNGQLDYRFTGKEWDEETGLYDFHTRLYDPELGRFYQMDPKEQYASPYMYAGNSPVSLIDPDGQYAILMVVLAAVGAASANGSWNPTKRNLERAVIGLLIGVLIGYWAPNGIKEGFAFLSGYIGATAAVGVMAATSIGFAYMSMASANGNWDPSKWDWSSPATWNALFIGSLTGATLFNAIGGTQQAYLRYTGITRNAFVIVATGTTGGFFLYAGSMSNDGNMQFWQWDWSKPGTVWGAIEGASFGLTVSPKLELATKQVAERLKNFKEIEKALQTGNGKVVKELLQVEAKAWRQIVQDVINGEHVKDGLAAGKAAGAKSGTSLLPKIPDKQLKAIEGILITAKLADILKTKKERSIEYSKSIVPMSLLNASHFRPVLANESNNELDGMVLLVSNSNRISHWINKLLESIFINSESGYSTKHEPKSNNIQPYTNNKQSFKRTYEVPNCFFRTSDGTFDRVVCYEQYGLSYVFPHEANGSMSFTEDSYSRCYPIEYEGSPSVVCSGATSSYVFTPNAKPINYLDQLNGALMLLLVAPAVTKTIASFFRKLLTGKTRNQVSLQNVSAQEKYRLNKKLSQLYSSVRQCGMRAKISSAHKWMNIVLEDIDEDVKPNNLDNFLNFVVPSGLYYGLCDPGDDATCQCS
ncbi:uncharacterized protein LOC131285017 [Anopheles ziemanni]|uniref:uncharacterized protein LOC131262941 n=1 Tax=Anopheles coustani TaxID=139045 RepID=UPI00265A0DF2|nr:uncharacterized protein LOC131262941 [Anopheles coustani]XP_058169861.1 uncharacterized protein LOC131285017 [Anopheles ziemanni]